MIAAVTPTAGNVLFTGDLNGNFLTLDSRTGDRLYSFNTGGAIGGGVITYEVDAKQYVAVAAGNASRTTWYTAGRSKRLHLQPIGLCASLETQGLPIWLRT